MLALLLLAACLLSPLPAAAQSVATSPAPDAVSVTVYRDPNRPAQQRMELTWLNGFALISETRTVTIPAGDAEIRFEGVAGGILPESAIVTGLPKGVTEKNQDAWLLSPASLIERSLGRRVHLRRTSLATGEVREQEAVVRSSADGAVVLQTPEGFEALRCTGLPETIVYDSIPEGLSAKPTLSVRTRSDREAAATLTLSYLASGFDWQANYIGTLSPAGDRLDLFAWVTLANGDETSFRRANTQTVAGRLNRVEAGRRMPPTARPLQLQCWPAGTTSDIPLAQDGEAIVVTGSRLAGGAPPPPPPPPPPAPAAPMAMKAQQEELGDLKLYRIPEPVTVASNSQKQVAMLEKNSVKVERLYRAQVFGGPAEQQARTMMILRTRNRTAEGLGLPLPAGGVALFGAGRARPILLGEGSIEDKAVGEDVEIEIAESTGVVARVVKTGGDGKRGNYLLTVTNDQARPVRFEADFADVGLVTDRRIGRRNGRPLWSVTVPANGSATLNYQLGVQR
jgi:hypothetical protein